VQGYNNIMSKHKVLYLSLVFGAVFVGLFFALSFDQEPEEVSANHCAGSVSSWVEVAGENCSPSGPPDAGFCDGTTSWICDDGADFDDLDTCLVVGSSPSRTWFCSFAPSGPDVSDPVISMMVTDPPGTPDDTDPITMTATANDTGTGGSGIAAIIMRIDLNGDGDMIDPGEFPPSPCTWSPTNKNPIRSCERTIGPLSAGVHIFWQSALDAHGNEIFGPSSPFLSFTVEATPVLSVVPFGLTFGDVDISDPPATGSFFVDNLGGGVLTGSVTGLAAPFACTSGCSYSLLASDPAHTVTISFDPSTAAFFSDDANFSCTSGCVVSTTSRPVTGTGTGGGSAAISVEWSPVGEPVDFGAEVESAGTSDKSFFVKNVGGAGTSLSGSALPSGMYSCVGSCSYGPLDPSDPATVIEIRFAPTTTGTFSQSLGFSGGGGKVVSITGMGVAAGSCTDTESANDPYVPGDCIDAGGTSFPDACPTTGGAEQFMCSGTDCVLVPPADGVCNVGDTCPLGEAACVTPGGAMFTVGSVSPLSAEEGAPKLFSAVIIVAAGSSVVSCTLHTDISPSTVGMGNQTKGTTSFGSAGGSCDSGETCVAEASLTYPVGSAGTHSLFVKCGDGTFIVSGSATPITVGIVGCGGTGDSCSDPSDCCSLMCGPGSVCEEPSGGGDCGDGSIDPPGEECDDDNTDDGDGCDASCQLEISLSCNNDGTADVDEVCDGGDLRGKSCSSFGFAGGTLACDSSCNFVTSACTGSGSGGGSLPPTVVIEFINPIGADTFAVLINDIIDFIFTVAVILAPILLIIAGIIFMTAAGDPGRVATARRMFIWIIIGFSIILISKGLVTLLKDILCIGCP